jgi:hypothetical protein
VLLRVKELEVHCDGSMTQADRRAGTDRGAAAAAQPHAATVFGNLPYLFGRPAAFQTDFDHRNPDGLIGRIKAGDEHWRSVEWSNKRQEYDEIKLAPIATRRDGQPRAIIEART